jgi:hypothetical protein
VLCSECIRDPGLCRDTREFYTPSYNLHEELVQVQAGENSNLHCCARRGSTTVCRVYGDPL